MYHKNVYHYLPYYPLFFMKNPCIPILTVHVIVFFPLNGIYQNLKCMKACHYVTTSPGKWAVDWTSRCCSSPKIFFKILRVKHFNYNILNRCYNNTWLKIRFTENSYINFENNNFLPSFRKLVLSKPWYSPCAVSFIQSNFFKIAHSTHRSPEASQSTTAFALWG